MQRARPRPEIASAVREALAGVRISELPVTLGGKPVIEVRDPVAIAHILHAPGQMGLSRAWVSGALDVISVQDYRELTDGPFDKIASVGMYEHVGRGELARYTERVPTLLAPGGLFLNYGRRARAGEAAVHARERARVPGRRRHDPPGAQHPSGCAHALPLIRSLPEGRFGVPYGALAA